MTNHEMHDFVAASQKAIEDEYQRIQKRATEDPGTAGDQGEENWATLLRAWLPSFFHIATKGRILTEKNYASPQVDLLVLSPSYPKVLLDKKLYLSAGVLAAFECKTTLKAEHVTSAVKMAGTLRRNLPERLGSPYRELNSQIIYGLLAHSHSWKAEGSQPFENIERALLSADAEHTKHPSESIELITVADLATWTAHKLTYLSPKMPWYDKYLKNTYGMDGCSQSGYVGHQIGAVRQNGYFSPLGVLLGHLFSRLAWQFPEMRPLEEYFRKVDMMGSGSGNMRKWGIEIFSEKIRDRIYNGQLSNGSAFDEWSIGF